MARTAAKTIKSPKKKPVFIGVDVWSPGRRANNRYLVSREDALTKGILTIALAKGTTVLNGHADEKSKRVTLKNRSKFVQLGPNPIFVIAQRYDARFSPMR